MIQREFLAEVQKRTGLSEIQTIYLVRIVFDIIEDELIKGGSVRIAKFGTFKAYLRKFHGYDHKKGETIYLEPRLYPRFEASSTLKRKLATTGIESESQEAKLKK